MSGGRIGSNRLHDGKMPCGRGSRTFEETARDGALGHVGVMTRSSVGSGWIESSVGSRLRLCENRVVSIVDLFQRGVEMAA